MKRCKTVLDDMPRTAMQKEPTTSMPIGGLPKENGMLITRPLKHHPKTASEKSLNAPEEKSQPETIQHNHIIQTKEKAESLCKLLQHKQPEKEYDVYRNARLIYPPRTKGEEEIIEKASQPCGEDLSNTLYMRYLAVHKLIKDEDKDKRDVIRKDFVACMEGFPEYAVTLALVDLVTDSDNIWFPALATLLGLMEKHRVYEPKIMDWESGFLSEGDDKKMWADRDGRDMDAWCDEILAKSKKESQEQRKLRGLKF